MANFSALKTAIQNAIKQNGNEEITGNVLQQILLSIVSSMGDGAINTIEQNLSSETLARQGADNTLQQNINSEAGARQSADNTLQSHIDSEALARGNADTQLQNAINAIKANIDNGYVYAGIATPTTTPVSGKVFYIATAAGTYTNFGGQVLTQGINILRFNGSVWSSQQLIGIDDVPTAGSNNLVKSSGVQNELALGAVYDVSAKNPTAGPNNDGKWESLSALLSDANLNTLIPTAYRKGGMSIKYVQTNDNKYVQFRLMADTFSTTESDWQGVDDKPTAGSPNLVESGGVASKFGNLYKEEKTFSSSGYTSLSQLPPIKEGKTYHIVMFYSQDVTKQALYLRTANDVGIQVENTGVALYAIQASPITDVTWTASQDAYEWGIYAGGETKANIVIVESGSVEDSLYELMSELKDKQDVIPDLNSIRSGAQRGATAVVDNNYVHTDNNFTDTDKQTLSKLDLEINGRNTVEITDFSGYDNLEMGILANGKWNTALSECILIPVTGGDKIQIENSGSSTNPESQPGVLWFSCLTDDYHVNNQLAHICSDFVTDYGNRIEVTTGGSSDIITVPSDCVYVAIMVFSRLGKVTIFGNKGIDEKVSDLQTKTDIGRDSLKITDFSSYKKVGGIIVNGKWLEGGQSTFIPVTGKYLILQNSQIRNSFFSLLKNDNYTVGANVDYCDVDRSGIALGERLSLAIPDDCKFLCVTTQLTSSGVTYNTIPTYVEFPAVLEQSDLQKDDGVYSHLYGEQFSQAGNALIGGILERRDFSFCHITDMHGTFVAAKAANDVRDRYNYFIPILNTGDVVKGEPRLNNVLAKDFTDYMVLAQKYRIFHICGQHEVGFTNLAVGAQYNGKLKSNCLSHQQVIDYYIAPMAAIWGIATPTTPYWYKDFTEEKVRLIGLYQYNSPLTDDPNDSDYYLYERGKCWYGQDQLDWFCNLLKTASANYRIVVMMHEADGEITLVDNAFKRPDRNTAGGGTIINGSPIFDILDAFVSRGTLTRDYYAKDTVTYPTNVFHMSVDEDFSDAVADYGVCLGGDFHTDHIGTFGTNKLLYKGMTASCEQATDCHVDGAATIPNVSYKDLSCNCVADTCGITFSKNILSLARVGQTGSVFSQDRRFCRVSIKE